MSLFSKILGEKKSIASVLLSTQSNIFAIYGVTHPTDAQKTKAFVYLCISGIAILNDFGGEKLRHAIDRLYNETIKLTKPLNMRVGELANNAEQLQKIISEFPSEIQISESTIVNGLAAFEAIYFSMGKEVMTDIIRHNKGPLGTPGYAAIVVAGRVVGEGKAREKVTEVSMEMLKFTKELAEAL